MQIDQLLKNQKFISKRKNHTYLYKMKSQDKFKGKSISAEQKYIGIQNIGATCYMNSVIQTLFMTQEFRYNIFSQNIDVDKVKQIEKSIPIQIQKLFALLQIKKDKKISTQDLIKSFGWTSGEAFQQHDSQEFIRILFEAIDNTFKIKFINELYQGNMVNYVKCLNCQNESLREEQFLDIQLTIKNDFENIKNESIDEAFVNLMRPEQLVNDNKYFCETCNSKQDALRGCRIEKIPEILTIQLNRFTYDYMMDRRVKLNNLFKFPYILNMNQFDSGYQGIPQEIKNRFEDKKTQTQKEQEELQKQKEEANKQKDLTKPSNQTNNMISNDQKKKIVSKEDTKQKGQNLRDFLKNERLKNKKDKSQKEEVEIELFTDDVKGEKYVLEVNEIQDEQVQQNLPPPPPAPILLNLDNTKNDIPPPPPINILNTNLGLEDNKNNAIPQAPPMFQSSNTQHSQNLNSEQEKQAREQQLKEYLEYLNSSYQQYWTETEQQIQEYLKDGDNVYELFSICMHSGGAYGGHYYAFIKSFEDKYWYKFNDSSVTYMELEDVIKKAYGGSDFNNAYMLFYRKYSPNSSITFNDESIPIYLQKILEEEEKLKQEANKVITLKYDVDMKLKQQKGENLNQNNIKSDMEIEQSSNNSFVQICLANQHNLGLEDLNSNLEVIKIEDVNQSLSIEGLQKLICIKFNAQDYKRVLIFRKIITEDQVLGQQLNIFSNKSLKELEVTQEEVLFVEIQEEEIAQQYKWVDKFEEISSTIYIRYNIPSQEEELQTQFSQKIKIDSRRQEQYLKQVLCETLKIEQNQVILRFDGPMGKEIKNMNSLIKENHAFNRKVYIQYGIPCNQNEYRNKLYIAQPQSLFEANIFFLFEEVGEIITDRNWNLDELKEAIRKNLRNKNIPQYTQLCQDFEVREKYQFKLRRLYKQGLLSEQFVSEKTEFAVEFKETTVQNLSLDQYKLYVRILDSQNNTLKDRFEIIVKQEDTLHDLANNIFSYDKTVNVSNMCVILVKDVENFQLNDLISEEWICLNNNSESIIKAPLKVSNDGQLLIVKDQDLNLAQFNLQNLKDMRIQNQRQEKAQKTRVNKIYHPKEKALKINYQQDNVDEQEQDINAQEKGNQQMTE
ncbi:ubiquitin carboxy-terminal hydrolase (macronuclear) [Tetrahymena thermophila SB210]|uniref:Ubiquitin carboxy-terminal hydrolase n=1 Tax=Tetrahymena thermophila (strain SB210) TaxID=312017 RepID=Q23KE7_TETTS|nr:ubiquitin carboxy-terminal hydrolase [Tetrahymena thermophila SB210]EAR96896.3 ubiquitin carboxy-terminal hydrolase [Tetrahymena thermophila SB210]|eukprot:XP_001017141.3 ubiquitin carboxy-terminal hydrolase [Tetrahymena thermophila SB210]